MAPSRCQVYFAFLIFWWTTLWDFYFSLYLYYFSWYALIFSIHILLWPSISFFLVAISYTTRNPILLEKQPNGKIHWLNLALLLPYLLLLWLLWHIVRFLQKEKAHHKLDSTITIGRRLFPREMPENISIVIDLTCEFFEPNPITQKYQYISFPILDGTIPLNKEKLGELLQKLALEKRNIYIHCAQGHGRTALFTALLLIKQNKASTPKQAMEMLQEKRPLANMRKEQWTFVCEYSL